MKAMTDTYGTGAVALPFHASTSGVLQGRTVPTAVHGFRIAPAAGGSVLRLRARDLTVAPDSVSGGPVI